MSRIRGRELSPRVRLSGFHSSGRYLEAVCVESVKGEGEDIIASSAGWDESSWAAGWV